MKIKAQRYWRTPNSLRIYGTKKTANYYSGFAASKLAPVYVLPADAASVERMVEQMARAFAPNSVPWDHLGYEKQVLFIEKARAALAAIGIK